MKFSFFYKRKIECEKFFPVSFQVTKRHGHTNFRGIAFYRLESYNSFRFIFENQKKKN